MHGSTEEAGKRLIVIAFAMQTEVKVEAVRVIYLVRARISKGFKEFLETKSNN